MTQITREITFTCYDWPPGEGGPCVTVSPVAGQTVANAVVEIGMDVLLETPFPWQLRTLAAQLLAAADELDGGAK